MSRYPSIVVLTGAGVSTESGIKTFRDHNGLWENHRLEDVCTPEAFARNPHWYNSFITLDADSWSQRPTPIQLTWRLQTLNGPSRGISRW